MNFIQDIIAPLNNCENTGLELCKAMNIRITSTSLVREITEHPDYPSLLSISDMLTLNGVDNVAIKTSAARLTLLSTPFIIQIQTLTKQETFFTVVFKMSENDLEWINPETQKKEFVTFSQLNAQYTGFALVAEPTELSGEANFEKKWSKEKWNHFLKIACLLFIPLSVVVVILYFVIVHGIHESVFSITYIILTLCGLIASVMLLLSETDQRSLILQKICTVGGRMNCTAVLDSHGAKIGGIHWSVIGVSYFLGVLLVLLVSGIVSHSVFEVAAWLSILALPYAIYSIIYQGFVVKQWCPLCLAVQSVFVTQFLIALSGGFFVGIADLLISAVIPYAILIIISFLLVRGFMFGLQKSKASQYSFKALQRLKHDSCVFDTLLIKQKQISESPLGLGIALGNPEGKWHIIKVCNPYCTPCAMAHSILDSLLESNQEIKFQIIFTVAADNNDKRNRPIKLFLALQENHQDVKQALVDWFKTEDKNYDEFAEQYSMSDNLLDNQIDNLEKMRDWCMKTEIRYTPTIFINNCQLPDVYTVTDLRYFLSA